MLFSLFIFHWTLTLVKIAFYSPCQWLKRKAIFCRQGPSLLTTLPEGFYLDAAPGVVPIDRTLQPTPLPAFLSTYIPKVRCVVYGVTNVSSTSRGTVWYHLLLCSCKWFPQQRANLLVTSRSCSFLKWIFFSAERFWMSSITNSQSLMSKGRGVLFPNECWQLAEFNRGRNSSVGRAFVRRARGRGFDSRDRINTQGLKITEKWRYFLCPANG